MNLATRWNPLYWQCACLCVNSGSYADELDDDYEADEDEGLSDEDPEEDSVKRNTAPKYGKISRAIANAQHSGVTIELPDINSAQSDFVPDVPNNAILYSLRAVNVISDALLDSILVGRPYVSLSDFVVRVQPQRIQMVGLIKAGCFDALCKKPRGAILQEYLQSEADKDFPLKDKLTMVQIRKALDLGWTRPEYADLIRMVRYKQYIDARQNDPENKRYILTEEKCLNFFYKWVEPSLNASKNEYSVLPMGYVAIKASIFKRFWDKKIAPLVEYFNSEEGRLEYQKMQQTQFIQDFWNEKCAGTLATWEVETMGFYHSPHELIGVNKSKYNIIPFQQLDEHPDQNQISALVGTVVDRDNGRHTVTLLTPEGVVDVKFWAEAYAKYNQRISVVDPDTKKKHVIDESWFARGTKIIVYGTRRENMFRARRYFDGKRSHMVGLITAIHNDGSIDARYSRASNT